MVALVKHHQINKDDFILFLIALKYSLIEPYLQFHLQYVNEFLKFIYKVFFVF